MSFQKNDYSFRVMACISEVRSDVMYHAGIVSLLRGFFFRSNHSITRNVVDNVNVLDLSTESFIHFALIRAFSQLYVVGRRRAISG